LNTRLHANYVANFVLHAPIETHQIVNCPGPIARYFGEKLRQAGSRWFQFEIRTQFTSQNGFVGKGELFSGRLQEKVKGIVDTHFGKKIDLYVEFRSRFREHQPRQIVALGILLPIDEMLFGADLQRIRKDWRTTVRRRSQAYNLGTERNWAIVTVVRFMRERDADSHS